MSKNLAEIVEPLVEKGQFDSAETAIKSLMTDYVLRQIEHYRNRIKRFEKKYGMKYDQFSAYLKERAQKADADPSVSKKFMQEEEDALEWKIALEMLESWLGLQKKSSK